MFRRGAVVASLTRLRRLTVVIPIGDDNSFRRSFPFVTYGLIAISLAVFLVELGQPDPQVYITMWGVPPSQVSAGHSLVTLLTSMFLHAGWGAPARQHALPVHLRRQRGGR